MAASIPPMRVRQDQASGQYDLCEGDDRILRYIYSTIEPGALLDRIAEGNRKYARARSDYIHPLFGPRGEELTKDWSVDHPHHRGIYWAWPEVDWRGERGDLHALQRVFARPTGRVETRETVAFAELRAENRWLWEDHEPIVREWATLRAWRSSPGGRLIDLTFRFEALGDDVAVARRDTDKYGGLNLRCAPVQEQRITFHTDPPDAQPRMAWGRIAGRFSDAVQPASLTVFQHAGNPAYPGDWVEYPELNWLQPTFPAAGTRHLITSTNPLILRFRLWIRAGAELPEADLRAQWRAFNLSA